MSLATTPPPLLSTERADRFHPYSPTAREPRSSARSGARLPPLPPASGAILTAPAPAGCLLTVRARMICRCPDISPLEVPCPI